MYTNTCKNALYLVYNQNPYVDNISVNTFISIFCGGFYFYFYEPITSVPDTHSTCTFDSMKIVEHASMIHCLKAVRTIAFIMH